SATDSDRIVIFCPSTPNEPSRAALSRQFLTLTNHGRHFLESTVPLPGLVARPPPTIGQKSWKYPALPPVAPAKCRITHHRNGRWPAQASQMRKQPALDLART